MKDPAFDTEAAVETTVEAVEELLGDAAVAEVVECTWDGTVKGEVDEQVQGDYQVGIPMCTSPGPWPPAAGKLGIPNRPTALPPRARHARQRPPC